MTETITAPATAKVKGEGLGKTTKVGIAAGLGVALLIGGGGTFAVWNAQVEAEAGIIQSGTLELDADPGQWSSSVSGPIYDILDFQVVPGETLTYTQTIYPLLMGDNLKASVEVTGVDTLTDHNSQNITVSQPTLTSADGAVLPTTVLTSAQHGDEVTASVTFEFSEMADGNENAQELWNFGEMGYFLEQQVEPAGG